MLWSSFTTEAVSKPEKLFLLFHMHNIFLLEIPPLNERYVGLEKETIMLLAAAYLSPYLHFPKVDYFNIVVTLTTEVSMF